MSRKIVMLRDQLGTSNEKGSATRLYLRGETLSVDKPWQVKLADAFLSLNAAIEHKEIDLEKKDDTPSRAREEAETGPSKKPAKAADAKDPKGAGLLTKIGKKITG